MLTASEKRKKGKQGDEKKPIWQKYSVTRKKRKEEEKGPAFERRILRSRKKKKNGLPAF